MLEAPLTLYQTLLFPVDTAHGPAIPALDSSVMSVTADEVDNLTELRS